MPYTPINQNYKGYLIVINTSKESGGFIIYRYHRGAKFNLMKRNFYFDHWTKAVDMACDFIDKNASVLEEEFKLQFSKLAYDVIADPRKYFNSKIDVKYYQKMYIKLFKDEE